MTDAPRLTLGVPVYNAERYLAETLASLQSQVFDDVEILVADNASTDRTRELVLDLARHDHRIRLLTSPRNAGAAANYNRLVHDARGALFKWCGYDDLLEPTHLSRCVAALDAAPEAALAFPRTVIIDAEGRVVRHYEDRLDLQDPRSWMRVAQFARRVNLCNACFGVMRRDLMLQTGLIRPYVSSDIPFLAEMVAQGTFVQVAEPLFLRRVHDGSSRQGRTTMAEVAHWFDSARTTAPRAPKLRFLAGTVHALAAAPLPARERAALTAAYSGVTIVRRSRNRAGRLRAALRGDPVRPAEMVHQMATTAT